MVATWCVSIDWLKALDTGRAVTNVRMEFPGDWHRDPWGWPELAFASSTDPATFVANCTGSSARQVALIEVPKENWGVRPAVVLDPVDRLMYQALVDSVSVAAIGTLGPNSFGWRLPLRAPVKGVYSRNDLQWDLYRDQLSELAGHYSVALRTDIVSFFASIPLATVRDEIETRAGTTAITRRLLSFLEGFDKVPERSGLPQRSLASAVLANMVLIPLDVVLTHFASPMPRRLGARVPRMSFTRWMDDVWLFGNDAGRARRAQIALQRTAHSLGFNLNSSKTEVLEGNEVAIQAREVEQSAVDEALVLQAQTAPLEALVDRLLDNPEGASRTAVRFAVTRMRDHGVSYRVADLLAAAPRMPHVADTLALLFKNNFRTGDLQDWFLDYAKSDWAAFEWSTAQYARMFGSKRPPKKKSREWFASTASKPSASLPLLAVCSQRLAAWNADEARAVVRATMPHTASAPVRRVMALSALEAGESKTAVRKWLAQLPDNGSTLSLLESRHFTPPKVIADYAD